MLSKLLDKRGDVSYFDLRGWLGKIALMKLSLKNLGNSAKQAEAWPAVAFALRSLAPDSLG